MKIGAKIFKALSRTRSSISKPLKALKRKKLDGSLLFQLEENKPNDALRSCYVGLKFGNALSSDPFLMSSLLIGNI